MNQYLLSTHVVDGHVPGAPSTPEEMQEFMTRVAAVEAELDANGGFVFGGALHGPETSKVIDVDDNGIDRRDGPVAEANAHLAGFYIINAADMEEALQWAVKVSEATRHSIEVREFRATGRIPT